MLVVMAPTCLGPSHLASKKANYQFAKDFCRFTAQQGRKSLANES